MNKRVAAQEAFKLALSMMLMYWLALWMNWDMPGNGGLAIVLVSLGTAGASFNKGVMRIVGTTIGLLVGFLALRLFGQSPVGCLVFFTLYLIVIGYGMQSTSASYAWYVAGFLPVTVWASAYGSDEMGNAAFQYGSFRYLETTAGILIYTTVSVLIWPIRAGDQLHQKGQEVWTATRAVFAGYRTHLERDGKDDAASEADLAAESAKLSGALAQLEATLGAAFTDSSLLRRQKNLWQVMRVNLRGMVETLELWGESIQDCAGLDVSRRIPEFGASLARFDARLERIAGLGSTSSESPDHDEALLAEHELPAPHASGGSKRDEAALHGLLLQWQWLDRLSRELLRGARQLAGIERGPLPEMLVADRAQRVLWDPQRLVTALFPATCFVVAYGFWILFDPPSGPSIPSTTVAIVLNFVLHRMNAMAMIVVFFLGLWICVAPVYMWIMPALDSGVGLLAMIFLYTFLFGFLGAKKNVLKLIPILLLTTVTGISNQQSYSFMTLIVSAQMLLFCLVIIAVVDMLWASRRPEQDFLRALRRFLRGCASITDSYRRGPVRGRARRRRTFHADILTAPGQLQADAKHLDAKHFPGCDEGGVKSLVGNLQTITLRLQAAELAHQQFSRLDRETRLTLHPLVQELRELLRHAFLSLSRLEDQGEDRKRSDALERISLNLDREYEGAEAIAFHGLLGSTRGLFTAMDETGKAMRRFDWGELSKARF